MWSSSEQAVCVCVWFLTGELVAERGGDGGGLDERSLADVLQVFDLGDAVVVDEVVVLLGGGQGAGDLVTQVLDADVLVVARRHRLHQLCRVLPDTGRRKKQTWRITGS